MAKDEASIDLDKLLWVMFFLRSQDIIINKEGGEKKRVGSASNWYLSKKKSKQNRSNNSNNYASSRSNKRVETDETAAI